MITKTAKEENNRDAIKADLGIRIFQNARNRLYVDFPYLDAAFAALFYKAAKETGGVGTDGDAILFLPDFIIEKFKNDPETVVRMYMHMLIHCLYLHCFPDSGVNRENWDLACDISAALVMEKEFREESDEFHPCPQHQFLQKLKNSNPSAFQIYRMLEENKFSEDKVKLIEWFSLDDHSFWYGDEPKKNELIRKWNKIIAGTGERKRDHQKKRGDRSGNMEMELKDLKTSRYNYRKFLRKFAVPREEMEIDNESFDYIFYNLGMETYGNLPLIEPLEYREVNKLEELVIAIDTSGSCDAGTVRRFLDETYAMLSDRENFFEKMKVYLIQCDCCIQDVSVIHSREEWMSISRNFRVQGRGGTDFRPVFEYVEKLRKKKELQKLKALIYFTDGDGIFPLKKPEYETAFVFVRGTEKMNNVPGWALKLIV